MDQSKHCPCPGSGCNWPEGECLGHCTPIRLVEPAPQRAAQEGDLPPLPVANFSAWMHDGRGCDPDLLRPFPRAVNAFNWGPNHTERDKAYWEPRGYWQEPLFTADQMREFARLALAAAGGGVPQGGWEALHTKMWAGLSECRRFIASRADESWAWLDQLVAEADPALLASSPQPEAAQEQLEKCGNRDYCGRFPFCGCGGPEPLPERDTSKPAEQQGLFRKFDVRRTDGSDKPGGKHYGCEYFVLDVAHDKHAKAALAAYAAAVEETNPHLAQDMRDRYELSTPAQPEAAQLIEWADKDGVKHRISINGARELLHKFYDEWPGGWSEVEAEQRARAEAAPAVAQVPQCHKRANDYCKCSRKAMLCDGVGPSAAAPNAPAQAAPSAGEVERPLPLLSEIAAEVERAMLKFPTWPTDPLHALAVLGEEFGELTKDVLQLTYEPHKTSADNVRKEATQTAAMALRFLASLDTYEYRRGEQHAQDRAALSHKEQR